MKKYKVILTESEMRKLNEVRSDVRAKRLVADDIDTKDDKYITVDKINQDNYEKYIGKKVNVRGDVDLSNLNLKEIPITFGKVGGNFDCSINELTSLKSCPSEVNGDFDCSNNKLISLKGCPSIIKQRFYCEHNELMSLVGCPSEVCWLIFDCSHNKKKFTIDDVESLCEVFGKIRV